MASETDLPFVAGTAELGTVCGVVTTGNLEPDGTCTPATGTVIKGVAHSRITWTPQAIFKPFYLYAESVGRTVGDAIGDLYPAVAPVSISVTINPPTVLSGQQDIEVFAQYSDGGSHLIPNEVITFSSSNPLVASFGGPPPGGTATTTDTTDSAGRASTADLDTLLCLSEQTSVTITASSGPFAGDASLTIQPTAATADFNCTDAGDGNNVDCTDASTTPTGTNITSWSWDVDCDTTEDDDVENPTFAIGPGTTQICLTVTNDATCSSDVSKSVTVAAGAPAASFTYVDNTNGTASFTNTSTAAPATINTSFVWTFPTGTLPSTTSLAQNPANIDFGAIGPGPHSVTLTVTNNFGESDSVTNFISVTATPVSASFTDSDNGDGTADFTDTSTTPGSSTIASWLWTFPVGTVPPSSTAPNPTGIDFSGSTNDGTGGQFDVTLQVTNNFGTSDTISNVNVNLTAASPSASFSPTDNTDGTADFTDTSTASQSTITSWSWTFPAGTSPGASTVQSPTGVDFSGSTNDGTGGQFDVSFQVTDNFGNSDTVVAQNVNLTAASPTVTFSPVNNTNCTVTYTNTSSPSESTITKLDWTFAGGAPPNATDSTIPFSNQIVDYEATCATNPCALGAQTLQVTDNFGNTPSLINNAVSVTGCSP
jgi:PKD repeat protein